MKEKIEEALGFGYVAHKGQFRNNGLQPFISHGLDVLKQATRWGIKELAMLITAILHDTVEDTDVTNDDIKKKFGEEVAGYVKELTFDGSYPKPEYMNSFANASPQALVIKLADRFVNTMDFAYYEDRYAPKYFQKASSLIKAFRDRREELAEVFGKDVVRKINRTLGEVSNKMRAMDKEWNS